MLELACQERNKALTNPELSSIQPQNVLTLNLEDNESDYIVRFMLNLLEAVQVNEPVPLIIGRILINNLHMQITDNEITLTPKHQEIALSKVEYIRTEIIFDFVQKMNLTTRVDETFFKELAKKHYSNNKYPDAA